MERRNFQLDAIFASLIHAVVLRLFSSGLFQNRLISENLLTLLLYTNKLAEICHMPTLLLFSNFIWRND